MPKAKLKNAQVKWLPEALTDVERLYIFLHEKDVKAASKVAKIIHDGAKRLEKLPRYGRPMNDETGRREMFLPFASGAYVLRYRLDNSGSPVILRVWHSKEMRE